MLRITIPAEEFWDEVNEEFIYTKEQTLQLEQFSGLSFKMGIKMGQSVLRQAKQNRGRDFGLCQMHDIDSECEPRCI